MSRLQDVDPDSHLQVHDIDGPDHDGFPGGGTTFLRDDGTFATVPTGSGHTIEENESALTDRSKLDFRVGLVASDGGSGPDRIIVDLAPYYESGAGATISDGDFPVTPPNGMIAVLHDTTSGKSYLYARANGTWKGVELT